MDHISPAVLLFPVVALGGGGHGGPFPGKESDYFILVFVAILLAIAIISRLMK